VLKAELSNARNDYEDVCLRRLAEVLPDDVKVTILAGFADTKLFGFLAELGFGYVIRLKGNTKVRAADGPTRPASECVGQGCQSASNNQPASASNIQPFFWLQNPLSRESTGGTRARRGVPVMAEVAARVGGTCGHPWARHGRKEGQERFLSRQLSFPVSRISQW
jgi:hypothetical protein